MGSNSTGIAEIAARFTAAINGDEGDARRAEIFGETVIVWHQYAEPIEVPGALLAEMLPKEAQALSRAIPDVRHEDVRVIVGDDAFVMTRTTVGTVNGVEYASPVCSVVTVEDRKIRRIDAYGDREQDAALREALMHEFTPEA